MQLSWEPAHAFNIGILVYTGFMFWNEAMWIAQQSLVTCVKLSSAAKPGISGSFALLTMG